jgi:brefeldin A-inhibited guanine nucleotide-exchange protein
LLQVKPIIVADMLSTTGAKTSLADISGMTAAVQGFLNNVVAAAGYGAATETPEQLKQSVAAAIIGPRHSMELPEGLTPRAAAGTAAAAGDGSGGGTGSAAAAAAAVDAVSSSDEEEDEKNTFHLAPATSSEVAAAAAAGSSSSSAAAAAAAGSGAAHIANGDASAAARAGALSPPAGGGSAANSSGGRPSAKLAHAGSSGASSAANQGKALLLKDAFLVFRALCKLSIRTSDTLTISDPTAVRGKVCWPPVSTTVLTTATTLVPNASPNMLCQSLVVTRNMPPGLSSTSTSNSYVSHMLLQLLALELLKVLLENSGPTFRSNERFTAGES